MGESLSIRVIDMNIECINANCMCYRTPRTHLTDSINGSIENIMLIRRVCARKFIFFSTGGLIVKCRN